MTFHSFIQQNLKHYWRTNLAVILGVATAVAVLAGALLVGASVRGSLRELALQRLGKTDLVIAGNNFFREALATDLQQHPEFAANFASAAPLIALPAIVTHGDSNARAGNVMLYGVSDQFWQFHGVARVSGNEDDALVSAALARELSAKSDDTLVIRIEKPSAIPLESLHGRKDEAGTTLRLSLREVLPAEQMGEFALRPQQGAVRAVFVSLKKLQKSIGQEGRANTLLVAAKAGRANSVAPLEEVLRQQFQLADLGLKLRALPEQAVQILESDSALLNDATVTKAKQTAEAMKLPTAQVLTYLANDISTATRTVPYSLVTALDDVGLSKILRPNQALPKENEIILNDWAARDLNAQVGTTIKLSYFLWQESGQLSSQTSAFKLSAIVPSSGAALDRNYAPDYPGITDTNSLADWDPPFPIELGRVRPIDEDYWKQYRTTPKAFIRLADGQKLWASRYGKVTSLRLFTDDRPSWERQLRANLTPSEAGLSVLSVKSEQAQAARGATDFGEYFSYFSFFLVISALLLTGLFFKLGVEQRLREIGLLQALGFTPAQVRSLFLREGLLLAVIGSLLGVAGALLYGALIMWGLRTWWVGAVGTTLLRLHVAPSALLIGLVAGIITALAVVWLTLRSLRNTAPRNLLLGSLDLTPTAATRVRSSAFRRWLALAFGFAGLTLLALATFKTIGAAGGFFGAGFCLLIAALFGWSAWLRQPRTKAVQTGGWQGVTQLGFRNATVRAGRSVLCIALIASASFIIVAVDAFRRDGHADANDKKSGTGGFALYAESLLPLVRDPNSAQGRDELNLTGDEFKDIKLTRFRLRPGDDASCLNLYAPRNPRLLGVPQDFVQQGRFTFASSLAQTPEEKANPWLLLNAQALEIPVIGDANSLTYVLHKAVGDVIELDGESGAPLRLRIVAALQDSLLQGELLMADSQFTRLFPSIQGQRVFLIEATQPEAVSTLLEDRLSDYGFDAESTATRLAGFHQVENTYLSTFQALGALGLLLGTVGLAAVLLRNVLERRRELALLRATGYRPQHLSWLILAENLLLLGCGLLTGIVCALIAIAPAMVGRGGRVSVASLSLLLIAVLLTGLIASWVAVRAAVKAPLLASLRAE
ncbi:MAG: FtsX-like permease family protein [Acidobacteria bacterium]|nr:FtsX-like permease family protein [Acidobacteriota bacterium]